MLLPGSLHSGLFYSHVICLGTKMNRVVPFNGIGFYSHVICLGTKILKLQAWYVFMFYSHVICLGTKIESSP